MPALRFAPNAVQAMQIQQVLRQGSLIVIAILLAKSPLPASAIGTYEMLLYIGYALTFFWVSGLMQGMLAFHPRLPAGERPAFFTESYLVFLGTSLVLVVVLLLGKGGVLPLLTGQTELSHYELFLLFLLVHHPTFLLEHYLLLLDRPGSILRLSILTFVLQTGGVILPAFAGWGLEGSIWGLILLGMVRHVWLLFLVSRHGTRAGAGRHIGRWMYLSAPLVLYALLGGFHQTFDNWLVGWHYRGDEYRFAIFRYGARELPLALALTNAVGTALLPRVAAGVRDALPELRRQSRRLFHQLFPLTILLLLTSHWWFPRVFSPEFLPSVPVFNVFLLVAISRVVLSRTILMGLHDNRSLLIISIVELAANAGLSLALVGPFGLVGIAWGTLLAYSLEKVLQCVYLYRRHSIGIGQYTDLGWLGAYAALTTGAFLWTLA